MRIIGLSGTHASGKDTVARHLVEKFGFYHISTGDIFREEAMKKYGSTERPILYKTANEIRQQQGHGAVSHMALERYEKVKDHYPNGVIVSGFRAVAEAQVIKDKGGFIIFTDAPLELRFERMKQRAREGEGVISFEEFKSREAAENGGVDPAFNIKAIQGIADFTLVNQGDVQAFLTKAEKALGLK